MRLLIQIINPTLFICLATFFLSCSSDNLIIKEGCIEKNVVRIVVVISENDIQSGITKKDIEKEGLLRAEARCIKILKDALRMQNKPEDTINETHIAAKKIVTLEKRKPGFLVVVDCTLTDEVYTALNCR